MSNSLTDRYITRRMHGDFCQYLRHQARYLPSAPNTSPGIWLFFPPSIITLPFLSFQRRNGTMKARFYSWLYLQSAMARQGFFRYRNRSLIRYFAMELYDRCDALRKPGSHASQSSPYQPARFNIPDHAQQHQSRQHAAHSKTYLWSDL